MTDTVTFNHAMLCALVATLIISIIPFILLLLISQCRRSRSASPSSSSSSLLSDAVLRIFVCFAVGGLLGDAFLHLIPHSINPHSHASSSPPSPFIQHLLNLLPLSPPSSSTLSTSAPFSSPGTSSFDPHDHAHDHDHSHSHSHSHDDSDARGQRTGLLVLTGMLLFFMIEKIARLRLGDRAASNGHGHSHGHSHSHATPAPSTPSQPEVEGPAATVLRRRRTTLNGRTPSRSPPPPAPTPSSTPAPSLVGLLNLLADLSHNFTDGLAISASFLSSPALGLSTTLAVLIHEIPHEMGDFAILIQAGYEWRQAIGFQVLTAVGAVMGVAVVWMGGGGGDGMDWVLPVTAGGFVYVALCNVVPTVFKPGEDGNKGIQPWLQAAGEVTAMMTGVGLMVLIGQLE